MQADQLAINAHRRAAGRQAEHGLLAMAGAFANDAGDQLGDVAGQLLVRVENVAGQGGAGQRTQGGRTGHQELRR